MLNIKKIVKPYIALLIIASLTACSSTPVNEITEIKTQDNAVNLYRQAKDTLKKGLYSRAIELLNQLDAAFPLIELSRQIQFDLIYAHYESLNTEQAIAIIDRFIRLNPNDPALDYIYFMRGKVNIGTDGNLFQDMFNIDRADKDISHAREAFSNFKTLIEKYPESKYTADARQHMVDILDQLARRELYVAQYYMKRGAYLAAANRGKYILENYPNSTRNENALQVMIESYNQLGLTQLRDDAINVMRFNFPDNKFLNEYNFPDDKLLSEYN